ncbi:hypothetical protein N0V90_013544 [Kalmusia sp. IMI 367209]|nr:hypothetical protein N0V90_013544 [Kalmusia sp. IMI 367209]
MPKKKHYKKGCIDEEETFMDDVEAVPEETATAKPAASTELLEVHSMSVPEQKLPKTSPYASKPITINVGPGHATYYVLKDLLRSLDRDDIESGGEICLPGISADTGHTLVHYLYTGTYQMLESENDNIAQQSEHAFKHALLTYMAAMTYSLDELEQLAKQQIKKHGTDLEVGVIFNAIRKDYSRFGSSDWFREYLKDKTREAFESDYTAFLSDAFSNNLGKGKLNSFIMRYVVKLLCGKLTQTLQEKKDLSKIMSRLEQMLPEGGAAACTEEVDPNENYPEQHEWTTDDHLSFDFPSADCVAEEYVADVISIEDSSVHDGLPFKANEERGEDVSKRFDEAETKAKMTANPETPRNDPAPLAGESESRISPPEHTLRFCSSDEVHDVSKEATSLPCPQRSTHLMQDDTWKTCERCCATLREVAMQLAQAGSG